ncbi:MAG TPA: HAMP domain-containing sensor histidine kinase [Mycobacteriales bacterium]|nr:HAMP domain-containing sensor histidine kinase [Mycobacteriales bacterium]
MTQTGAPAAAGAQPAARWWDRRTLRFRVLASLLAVLLIAFAVIGVVTVFALSHFLTGRLDQQLNVAGARYVAAAQSKGTSPRDGDGDGDFDDGFGDERGQQVGTLGARIQDSRITGFGIVGRREPPALPAADRALLLGVSTRHFRSYDLGRLGDYRLRAYPAAGGERLVVGLPLKPVHETLAELLAVELVVFAVVLVATAASSGWLVGFSLRPLARITATAREVAATPLTDSEPMLRSRVATPNPGSEVGQLGLAFNHMLDHVEASLITRRDSEERLRRFIADASHELRTPVASIRGHAESVRHGPEELPASLLAALARIESEAGRMGVLVDDLLLLARLDAGRELAKETVDLSRISIDAVSDARVAGRDHRWLLDLPPEPVLVTGDDHRLRELVNNLLTNARVHTPAGTVVRLEVTADDAARMIELRVSDNGPGIPGAAQARVFERFYRADSVRAPETGSSGLGLAIVEAVARAHGGSVGLASGADGTTVSVRLPL